MPLDFPRMRSVYKRSFKDMVTRLGGTSRPFWEGVVLFWTEDNKYNLTQIQHAELDRLVEKNGIGFLSQRNIIPEAPVRMLP